MGCGVSDLNPDNDFFTERRRKPRANKIAIQVDGGLGPVVAGRGGKGSPAAGDTVQNRNQNKNPLMIRSPQDEGQNNNKNAVVASAWKPLLGKQRYILDSGALIMPLNSRSPSPPVVLAVSGGAPPQRGNSSAIVGNAGGIGKRMVSSNYTGTNYYNSNNNNNNNTVVNCNEEERHHLIVYTNEERSNLVFVFSEQNGRGPLYVKEFTNDEELSKTKAESRVQLPWPSLFKSIASCVLKGKATVGDPIPVPITVTVPPNSETGAASSGSPINLNGQALGGGGGTLNNNNNNTNSGNNNNNVTRRGASFVASVACRTVSFTITSSKEPSVIETFAVRMELISRSPNQRQIATYVIQPMIKASQSSWNNHRDRELCIAKAIHQQAVAALNIGKFNEKAHYLRQRLGPLRKAAEEKASETRRIVQLVSSLEYKIYRRLERAVGGVHPLDKMYSHAFFSSFPVSPSGASAVASPRNPYTTTERGMVGGGLSNNNNNNNSSGGVGALEGPAPFVHAPFATPYMPKMPTINEPLATLLARTLSQKRRGMHAAAFGGQNYPTAVAAAAGKMGDFNYFTKAGEGEEENDDDIILEPLHEILRAPPASDPVLTRMYHIATPQLANAVMSVLHNLEDWGFNVFELEQYTQGNALFYTCYSILNRLDLISHFKIDDRVMTNFLRAVQAGYHPNPYHNKTHAADVCQATYFILMTGGLIDKCRLTKEDLLACILASAIHDYDHPGFNNSLHTRTNAYLSTLYNDRSILENHHLACVFEMTRLPQFDIFKSLSEEQRRTVRETMIEMVLATDMGSHARIMDAFKRSVAYANKDWTEKDPKSDAMCVALKMADINNCTRPKHLYLRWAKNISAEFYMQGDVESRLGLAVSPFMDRKKEKTDFPKGQISFINYVVEPMVEAVAKLLPNLSVALFHCQRNKEDWLAAEQ